MSEPRGQQALRRDRRFKIAVAMVLVAVALTIVLALAKSVMWAACAAADTAQCLSDFMTSLKLFGLLASAALMIVSSLTFLPDELVAVANGIAFGPWLGSAASWFGAMCAANIVYWLGRRVGLDALEHVVGEARAGELTLWVEKRGALALLGFRLLPLVPSLAVSFAAGTLRIPLAIYNVTTGLAIIPTLVVFSVAGGHLTHVPAAVWISFLAGSILVVAAFLRFKAARDDGP